MIAEFPTVPGYQRRVPLATILIVAGFLLSACVPGIAVGDLAVDVCAPVGTPPPVTGVFVEPDDGYAPVLDEIEAARCSIDLNMYMLTDDEIFDALADARDRGVEVRVLLDQHPFGMFGDQQEAFDRLSSAGISVRWSPSHFQFSHAKYMVIDQSTALIMNQNFTGSAFNSNREFGVITTHPEEIAQLSAIFEVDWTGEEGGGIAGPLFVSPENARERLIALIGSADASIDFYAELIRDEEVLAALEDAVSRGVQVRLIMNASLDPEDVESVTALASGGVEVRLTRAIYIHSKTMIVDGDAALVGSINYSMTSLDRNREVAMLLEDPALLARIVPIFEHDWVRGIPLENAIINTALRPLDM